MRKGLILVNAYTQSETELNQPKRLLNELSLLGVQAELHRNLFVPPIGGAYDFCVYFDKDKYCARRLEQEGVRLFNRAEAIELCDDKMLTCLALSGFPMPKTLAGPLCYTEGALVSEELLDRVERELGYPVIVKECYGSLGKAVYKAEDRSELKTLCERVQKKPHLFQEFVSSSAGTDVRAIVVGDEVVCAMKRTSRDFRSNIGLGGTGEPYALDADGKSLCLAVAKRLNLDYCGIDLLFSEKGFLVCEVNSNAFFGTAEKVTGVNVAQYYAKHIIRQIYG